MKIFTWFRVLRSTLMITLNKHIIKSGISDSVKINGFTILTKNTEVGKDSHFNGARVYGKGKVIIGAHFHSGKGLNILTQNHNFNGVALPYDDTYIIKDTIIEDNVWVGMNVTILPGVRIGEGAIIQACSVVVCDIPSLSIAGGNPARPFSQRNPLHYNEIKNIKK